MKKIIISVIVISSVLVCITSIAALTIRPMILEYQRQKMREELAQQLGVRIEEYPYEKAFPVGYFNTVLTPGMPISDVHAIVLGYEKVLRCGTRSEIYYFYSSDLDGAKRLKIIYDGQGYFVRLEGEEEDSRTIQIQGCQEGLIDQ